MRYEYRLTRKGVDLWPVIVALMKWGDQYAAPDGPPTLLLHKDCGGEVDDRRRCTRCGAELEAWDVVAGAGPRGERPTGCPSRPAPTPSRPPRPGRRSSIPNDRARPPAPSSVIRTARLRGARSNQSSSNIRSAIAAPSEPARWWRCSLQSTQ